MDLEPAAGPATPFARGRLEAERPQAAAGKVRRAQDALHLAGVDERGAEQFERQGRAPPLGDVGPLPEYLAGIDQSGGKGGHVGRGEDPGQAGVRGELAPPPPLHGHHFEVCADGHLLVAEQGQFAQGEAVAHGNGAAADKGGAVGPQQVALHQFAADGVRPVEDDHPAVGLGRGLEAVDHGPNKRVDAGADIDEINQQHIDVRKHERGRFAGLAVEGMDRQPGLRIDGVVRLDHVVLLFAVEPVLRRKQAGELVRVGAAQEIAAVGELAVGGRLVGEQPESSALERGQRRAAHLFDACMHHVSSRKPKNGRRQRSASGPPLLAKQPGFVKDAGRDRHLRWRSCARLKWPFVPEPALFDPRTGLSRITEKMGVCKIFIFIFSI